MTRAIRFLVLCGLGFTLMSAHVLEVNPDALAIADRLDAERASRGPSSRPI